MVRSHYSCAECKGFGFIECNYGYDHTCMSCNGTGEAKVIDDREEPEYYVDR